MALCRVPRPRQRRGCRHSRSMARGGYRHSPPLPWRRWRVRRSSNSAASARRPRARNALYSGLPRPTFLPLDIGRFARRPHYSYSPLRFGLLHSRLYSVSRLPGGLVEALPPASAHVLLARSVSSTPTLQHLVPVTTTTLASRLRRAPACIYHVEPGRTRSVISTYRTRSAAHCRGTNGWRMLPFFVSLFCLTRS